MLICPLGWVYQEVESEVLALQKAMGADIDVTIDCVGFTKSMKTALKATRAGGRVCLVGMGHNEMTLPLTPAAARLVSQTSLFDSKRLFTARLFCGA